MEAAADAAGSERLRAKQLSALILKGRVIHDTHEGRQEYKILPLPDFTDAAFQMRCIVFMDREVIGKAVDVSLFFLCQPSAEDAALQQRNDHEKEIGKQDENKGRDQDTGVFLPESRSLPDRSAHAG